jgi:hypothetical protein
MVITETQMEIITTINTEDMTIIEDTIKIKEEVLIKIEETSITNSI